MQPCHLRGQPNYKETHAARDEVGARVSKLCVAFRFVLRKSIIAVCGSASQFGTRAVDASHRGCQCDAMYFSVARAIGGRWGSPRELTLNGNSTSFNRLELIRERACSVRVWLARLPPSPPSAPRSASKLRRPLIRYS